MRSCFEQIYEVSSISGLCDMCRRLTVDTDGVTSTFLRLPKARIAEILYVYWWKVEEEQKKNSSQ